MKNYTNSVRTSRVTCWIPNVPKNYFGPLLGKNATPILCPRHWQNTRIDTCHVHFQSSFLVFLLLAVNNSFGFFFFVHCVYPRNITIIFICIFNLFSLKKRILSGRNRWHPYTGLHIIKTPTLNANKRL